MTLEPASASDDDKPRYMMRRFCAGMVLSVPLLALPMGDMELRLNFQQWLGRGFAWTQFVLPTPMVLWAGWPFFVRGWKSLYEFNFNMFTRIALGAGEAYTVPGVTAASAAAAAAANVTAQDKYRSILNQREWL